MKILFLLFFSIWGLNAADSYINNNSDKNIIKKAVLNVYDFKDIYELSSKNNKPILLMATMKGCPSCKYMEEKILTDEEIIYFINKKYNFTKLYKGDESLKHNFELIGYPTFYLIDKNKKIMEVNFGMLQKNSFIEFLKAPF